MQVVDSEGYLKVKLVGGPVGPFVPYTGATANVDLGEYEIKAGQFTLDTSPTGTAVVGTTRWNNTIGSSETTLKGGSVILKNGVDLVARVVNKVTPNTTLTKAGYAAVRVSGAQGQRLAVAYAQADSDANSADTIGLVTETIATNQEGFIMTVGQLEGINTTGSLQGETWVDGNVLYLSPTIPGALTNIKPNGSTGHIVVMGYVEYAHAINGKIYVKIMNGWELDELHNVYINPATIANNNILQYDSADQLWKNQVLNTGITIGTTAIASGTVGRVLFEGTGNVVQESAQLSWNNSTNALLVTTGKTFSGYNSGGSASDALKLELTGGGAVLGIQNSNASGFSGVEYLNNLGSPRVFTGFNNSNGQEFRFNNFASGGYIDFLISATSAFRIFNTRNIGINTTTDAGFRLDVNGTARVISDVTLGNSSFFGGGFTGTTSIRKDLSISAAGTYRNGQLAVGGITNNGAVVIGYSTTGLGFLQAAVMGLAFSPLSLQPSGGNVLIGTTTDAGFRLDVNGTARVQDRMDVAGTNGRLIFRAPELGTRLNGIHFTDPNDTVSYGYIGLSGSSGEMRIFARSTYFPTFYSSGLERMRIFTSGNVLINTTTDVASSKLTIESTTQGFLPPRMTTTQKNAIASPAAGLQIFDTTLNRPCFYDGTTWITL